MPRIPAFRRSALSVRFIFLAISGRGVRAFECALSSRTSSLVHEVRWAEVFFFGTDCCSGKGSRLRATPVAWSTHASKRIPHLATPLRWPLTWPRTPACRFRGSVRGSAASINRNGEVSEHRASDHPVSANTGALDEREEGAPQGQCRFARTAPLVHLQGPRRHQCWRSRLHAVDRGGDRGGHAKGELGLSMTSRYAGQERMTAPRGTRNSYSWRMEGCTKSSTRRLVRGQAGGRLPTGRTAELFAHLRSPCMPPEGVCVLFGME